MPQFSYKAAQKDGAITQGSLVALSQAAALRQLRGQGLTPVRLWPVVGDVVSAPAASEAAPAPRPAAARPSWLQRNAAAVVSRDEVLALTSELAVLLRAGLPIDRALKVQIDMSSREGYTGLLRHLLETVKGGKPLSHGLERRSELFGNFYVNMVRSGEASGQLGTVFDRLAEYLHRSKEVRSTVVSALIYPAILAVVALLSVAVMLGFVVPQFEALFADMGDGLPGLTRAVIALGDAVKAWGWLMLLVLVAAWYSARAWLARPEGSSWKDRKMLRLPLLGAVLFKYELARFARTLGTLLGNGVSLLQAINIALSTVENSVVREALAILPPAVKAGRRMSDALAEPGTFTPMLIQMVRVGEESGRLDEMMLELARVYERDVESGIKRGLTVLEPLLILGMGGMIAVIIVSILMGILSVNDLAM
ncbi:type II secretion system F family protein [Haliea sp.]